MADLNECLGIELNRRKLIVNKNGKIYGLTAGGDMRLIRNVASNKHGYNIIECNGKKYARHRVMSYSYLELNLDNSKIQVDHIDGNRLNNALSNLRLVTHQQNQWNRTKALGYYFHKPNQNWCSKIRLNGKDIHLGSFPTEKQARDAYITSKLIHHRII